MSAEDMFVIVACDGLWDVVEVIQTINCAAS